MADPLIHDKAPMSPTPIGPIHKILWLIVND